ncbi:BON domain-containing protein [Stenotrophomonas sp. YIM B06876]|uniref:BON domain-containing protein n=1 Tax=Stenotrophomonas sp. YIM B06876 TaxID=3060211 RepID=UPI0027383732|nr:BON domain-containing protein [Stenotrophomonas sp. YIM B06876]
MNNHSGTGKLLASAAVLGLALAAGAAFAENPPAAHVKGESHEPVSDSWITTKVKADLLATKHVSGTEIKVDTVNGVVTLSGSVGSEAERERAIGVAKKIKGVSRVEAMDLKVDATKR